MRQNAARETKQTGQAAKMSGMDDRTRYETVKSRLRAMGQGTAQQVHDAIEPSPYSVREVENTLDEMMLAEQDEFERVDAVYRWKKHFRFGTGKD